MINLNTYITEKLHIKSGMNADIDIEDYDFKILVHNFSNNSKEIVERTKSKYDKDISARIAQDIFIDKLLVKNKFNRRDKIKLVLGSLRDNGAFYIKSPINENGYCVIFDEFMTLDAPWSFVVTKAVSKAGKTLKVIEFVEPKDDSDKIHEYDMSGDMIPKTFYDNIDDAWDYIEKKYGKF